MWWVLCVLGFVTQCPLRWKLVCVGNIFALQLLFKGLLDLLTNRRDDCQDLTHNLPKPSVRGISGSEEDIPEGLEG